MFIKKLIKKSYILLIINMIFFTSFCQAKIITSIKPLGFITEAIASGVSETDVLLPDGASPHTYSLKPSDLIKLNSADLIIWVGEDMETFMPSVLKDIDNNKTIELTEYPTIEALLKSGEKHGELNHADEHHAHHEHGRFDNHIWLSPKIAEISAQIIHDKLQKIYPQKAALLEQNLHDFLINLKQTEQNIAKKLNSVQNKGYFVFHDSYAYFEAQFNLNNLGSFTINPSIQPGLKKIYEIQKELKNRNAVCIFREPQFSPVIVYKLIDGTNVKVGELDPLGMDIVMTKDAYCKFLLKITQQLLNCLE